MAPWAFACHALATTEDAPPHTRPPPPHQRLHAAALLLPHCLPYLLVAESSPALPRFPTDMSMYGEMVQLTHQFPDLF